MRPPRPRPPPPDGTGITRSPPFRPSRSSESPASPAEGRHRRTAPSWLSTTAAGTNAGPLQTGPAPRRPPPPRRETPTARTGGAEPTASGAPSNHTGGGTAPPDRAIVAGHRRGGDGRRGLCGPGTPHYSRRHGEKPPRRRPAAPNQPRPGRATAPSSLNTTAGGHERRGHRRRGPSRRHGGKPRRCRAPAHRVQPGGLLLSDHRQAARPQVRACRGRREADRGAEDVDAVGRDDHRLQVRADDLGVVVDQPGDP